MAKKPEPKPAPKLSLAPQLDDDLAAVYFDATATLEKRAFVLQLQTVRLLRVLEKYFQAASVGLTLAPEPKTKTKAATETRLKTKR